MVLDHHGIDEHFNFTILLPVFTVSVNVVTAFLWLERVSVYKANSGLWPKVLSVLTRLNPVDWLLFLNAAKQIQCSDLKTNCQSAFQERSGVGLLSMENFCQHNFQAVRAWRGFDPWVPVSQTSLISFLREENQHCPSVALRQTKYFKKIPSYRV